MTTRTYWCAAAFFAAFMSVGISADQTTQFNKVMRAKLGHSQAILAAVITSDWASLDRESRALALVVRDPAWLTALTGPELIRESDAFGRAVQDLIEASAKKDLERAGNAQLMLTATCVRCHLEISRKRIAK
jgi:hypothetical protein